MLNFSQNFCNFQKFFQPFIKMFLKYFQNFSCKRTNIPLTIFAYVLSTLYINFTKNLPKVSEKLKSKIFRVYVAVFKQF